jgi:periplasmic glucans biosynthesis protein
LFSPDRSFDRRSLLCGAAALALTGPAAAQQQPTGALAFLQAMLQDGMRFDPAAIVEAARLLARRPFTPSQNALPDPFSNMNYETYLGIRHNPDRMVWKDENRPFQIEPLHRGFVYTAPVGISLVEEGTVKRVVYDTGRFTYGRLAPAANLPDLGFSGFRLMTGGENSREIAIFQGGTFFRAIARGQTMGVMARALALRTGDARGEEFPVFRAFWIERPGHDHMIVIHAVADSESATAAFRFTIRAGDITIMDTEATVFARTALDHIGFAPMQGTFLFAPNKRRGVDDLRPAVHEASGMQMLTGRGEWLWRPFNNPEQLQISSFIDENPRGFGLVQRERDFAQFQDEDQAFERRPTLWVEPIGDWGPGAVQLLEIPSDNEVNDNMIAYWRPRTPLAANSETSFAYRQFWCWSPPERPALAQASGFRVGRGSSGRRRRMMVEFAGEAFAAEQTADLRLSLSATPGQIINPRLTFQPHRKTARVSFELDPGSDTTSEMRLTIENGERPLTETWLYRWTP